MNKFELICKQHRIKAMPAMAFIAKFNNHLPMSRKIDLLKTSSAMHTNMGKYILLTEDDTDIVKWHELGHYVHPLGGIQRHNPKSHPHHTIISELSASFWALNQYDNKEAYQEGKTDLTRAAMTYITAGYNKCPDNDIYRILARKVGVEDKITWETIGRTKHKDYSNFKPTDLFTY